MSKLRDKAVDILFEHGIDIEPDEIEVPNGVWRQADVYRWEIWIHDCHRSKHYGCWETLTEFVREASKYGMTITENKGMFEISANEAPKE